MILHIYTFFSSKNTKKEEKRNKKEKKENKRKKEKEKDNNNFLTSRNIFPIENQMQVIPLARNPREKKRKK